MREEYWETRVSLRRVVLVPVSGRRHFTDLTNISLGPDLCMGESVDLVLLCTHGRKLFLTSEYMYNYKSVPDHSHF